MVLRGVDRIVREEEKEREREREREMRRENSEELESKRLYLVEQHENVLNRNEP